MNAFFLKIGNNDRNTAVPIATGAEAINILDSLIDNVTDTMDIFGMTIDSEILCKMKPQ